MYKVELPATIGDKTYIFRAQLAFFSSPVIFTLFIDDETGEHPRGQIVSSNGEWVPWMRDWRVFFPENPELDFCTEDIQVIIDEIERLMPR